MRLLLALALAGACGRSQQGLVMPANTGPAATSGSATGGSGAVGEPDGPLVTVEDDDTAKAALGKHASVHGTAARAKLAPAVLLDDGTPIYCLGIDAWPADLAGNPVVAIGLLEQTAEFAAGPGEAGTAGAVWVLRACTYHAM